MSESYYYQAAIFFKRFPEPELVATNDLATFRRRLLSYVNDPDGEDYVELIINGHQYEKIHFPALVSIINNPSTIQISLHTDLDKTPWLKEQLQHK